MIILNFKTYAEATGENAVKLLNAVQNVAQLKPELAQHIYSAPSMLDIVSMRKRFKNINIMSQHVDNKSAGSTTGWVTAENLIAQEIEFTVLNHAERRVWSDTIVEDIKMIQSKGVKVVVCCESLEEAKTLLEAQPYGIAYENKDLIGSGKSITQERPEAVQEFINLVKGKTKAIIGAGVSTGEDIKAGVGMGADGFILASAFVKAADPEAKATELAESFVNRG